MAPFVTFAKCGKIKIILSLQKIHLIRPWSGSCQHEKIPYKNYEKCM